MKLALLLYLTFIMEKLPNLRSNDLLYLTLICKLLPLSLLRA